MLGSAFNLATGEAGLPVFQFDWSKPARFSPLGNPDVKWLVPSELIATNVGTSKQQTVQSWFFSSYPPTNPPPTQLPSHLILYSFFL